MTKEESIVGELINFRGLVYSPINEQGVVFLFGRCLEELNMYIEEVRTKYPDCVARRYTGTGWKKVYVEFEYQSSNFIQHNHNPKECDIIICWEDDLNKEDKKQIEGVEIIELKSLIKDPSLKNIEIKTPEKEIEKSEYDLTHHFNRRNVNENIRQLYNRLDEEILKINPEIFRKFAKTAITYYSPEKNFVYLKLRKSLIDLHIYTNQQKIEGVKNIFLHENWGEIKVRSENELGTTIQAIKKSYELMKTAIKENMNTSWYAVTPKETMSYKFSYVDDGEHKEED